MSRDLEREWEDFSFLIDFVHFRLRLLLLLGIPCVGLARTALLWAFWFPYHLRKAQSGL